MRNDIPQFLDVDGRQIAILSLPPPAPGVASFFWLPGFASDMESTKATELAAFASGRFGMTRFDFAGNGRSGGEFADQTIGSWLEDAEAVFQARTDGPQVIVGSSMGGYIALLMLRRLIDKEPAQAARIKALVLIAPALDFTEALIWRGFTPDQQAALLEEGHFRRPTEDGGGQLFTRALIADGRRYLIADTTFDPGRPVHVLQGLRDVVVPPSHVRKLRNILTGRHLTIEEIPGGDHRLSRPDDIARLCQVAAELAG